MLLLHLTVAIVSFVLVSVRANPSIYTFHALAGNGVNVYSTESNALQAGVEGPSSAWGDSNGNIFFAQPFSNIIRKIDAGEVGSNTISTIGVPQRFDEPNTPDTGLANQVYFDRPRGVWGDNNGNLMIANTIGRNILRLDLSTNTVSLVAGDNTTPGNVDGAAIAEAKFWSPFAGFTDSNGNHFIVDLHGCVLRRIDGSTGQVTTIVGDFRNCDNSADYSNNIASEATIGKPYAVWGDNAGNIYFPEFTTGRIQKVDINTDRITTVLSGLNNPSGVWGDAAGNLFFSEFGAGKVSILASGTTTPVVLADGSNGLVKPKGIWGDAKGNIYIPDSGARRVFMLYRTASAAATPTTIPSGGGGSSTPLTVGGGSSITTDLTQVSGGALAANVQLSSTYYVWSDPSGNLFLTDTSSQVILRVDAATNIMTIVAGVVEESSSYTAGSVPASESISSARFNSPTGLWGDSSGNLYVADRLNFCIRMINTVQGTVTRFAGSSRNGGTVADRVASGALTTVDLGNPTSIWGDGSGNYYIYDLYCIFKITGGSSMAVFAGAFNSLGFTLSTNPLDIRIKGLSRQRMGQVTGDSDGNVYFSDANNGIYWKVSSGGQASIFAGKHTSNTAVDCTATPNSPLCDVLTTPFGIWVDSAKNVFYTNTHNNPAGSPDVVVRMTSPTATFYTNVFNPTSNPYAVYGDNSDNLYVAFGNGVNTYTYTGGRRRLLELEEQQKAIAKRHLRGNK